jgi:hypothetical protein
VTATGLRSEDFLREARSLLDHPTRESVSGWPRAVALLARMALETRLDAYWDASGLSSLKFLDMRAQLNCARVYLDPTVAGELSFAWYGLSRATHHRAYELDPTAEELRSLIVIVERANAAIAERVKAKLPLAG